MTPAARRIAAAAYLDGQRNHHAYASARMACIPYAAARVVQAAEQRPSSMCMGIGDFDHSDCVGGPCNCACHLNPGGPRAADPSLCHAAREDEGVGPLQATPSSEGEPLAS